MADRYEYYTTGADGTYKIYNPYWYAQTFTPLLDHQITSVKILIYKVGWPGTLYVGIKATDDDGHPTGPDLCSGIIAQGDMETWELWLEATLGAGATLHAGTKYAIVTHLVGGSTSHHVRWRRDASAPTYPRGNAEAGTFGSNWVTRLNVDCLFEDWGEAIAPAGRSFGYITG